MIREAYKNHENPDEIYDIYKNIVSQSYFYNLWEGKSWPNVHMDVYTEENKFYYKNLVQPHVDYRFTDEEVMMYRQRYVNETAEEIYNSSAIPCKFNSFKGVLSGATYKHLPIYNKKKKVWSD